jgi:hypothetical protein
MMNITELRLQLQCEGYEPTAVCAPGCTHVEGRKAQRRKTAR